MRGFKFLLAALTALSVLAGCHGSRSLPEFQLPDSFDTSRQYEISFWAKSDTNKVQTALYHQAIADFEQIYPNITVDLKIYTDYSRIYNDVITNISTQTTPNVCISYPDHIATYLTGTNVVVPLDELLTDETWGLGGSAVAFDAPQKAEIIPQFLEECRIQGHYYAVPYMRSTEALYINKTYVERMGYTIPEQVTWDWLWEVADAATAKNADGTYVVNGQQVMIPFIYKSTDNMMIQLLRQHNAGYSDADGAILIFNDTTRQILLDLAEHVRKGSFSTFKISSYPANFLNAGQCLFAIDSTAGSTWMGSEAPLSDIAADKVVQFETVVTTIPQVDPDHPQMISQGPSICLFNKSDPQEVLASWLFVQYLLSNDMQIAYSETEGYVPVTTKARDSAEYQDYLAREGQDSDHYAVKIQAAKLLLAHTGDTFTTPVFNGSASLRDAAGQLIENVTKSIRRNQTVDDAYIDQLFSDVTALYRLDQLDRGSGLKQDLGPLPATAKVLLGSLAAVWIGIGTYYLADSVKRRKQRKTA
jgi:multiple sugar transport system substrate-binding protein